jgi:hypothetical protein
LLNAKGFYDYGIKKGLTSAESVRLAAVERRPLVKGMIESGMSQRKVAKAFGVSHTQIQKDLAGNQVAKNGNQVATERAAREAANKAEMAKPRKDGPTLTSSIAKSLRAALDTPAPASLPHGDPKMTGNGAIPQRDLKQFLIAVVAVVNNPGTAERLLSLIERNERAVERFADEQADIARAKAQLARDRKDADEHIAQARNQWMAEERSRRAALEKDERKANRVTQPLARCALAEAEAEAAQPAQ